MFQRNKRETSPYVIATVILLLWLAFYLRLPNIERFGFWTDEGLTPLRSGYDLLTILRNEVTIQEGVGRDTHPPLYYLLIAGTRRLFGETDFAYRFPSVLAGVLLIPLLYQFGRRIGQSRAWVGMLVAFLAAINPLQIWYGNEARMYTVLGLLGTVAFYALWRGLETANFKQYFPRFLVAGGLAIYTHYTAIFLMGIGMLFWLWLLWQQGLRKWVIGLVGSFAVLLVPIAPFIINRLFNGSEANFFYEPPQVLIRDALQQFGLGTTAGLSQPFMQLLAGLMAAVVVAGFFGLKGWRKWLLAGMMFAAVIGLSLGSLIKPMYQGVRHIFVGSPAWILLFGAGIFWLSQKRFGKLLAVVAMMPLLWGSWLSLDRLYTNNEVGKDDIRGIIRFVDRYAGENDVLIFNDAVLSVQYAHYGRRTDLAVTALPTYPKMMSQDELFMLNDFSKQYDRIWFVTPPPTDERDEDGEIRGWLNENLTVVEKRNFFGNSAETAVITYTTQTTNKSLLPSDFGVNDFQLYAEETVEKPTLDIDPTTLTHKQYFPFVTNRASKPTGVHWTTLYWGNSADDPNLQVRLRLEDVEGKTRAESWTSATNDDEVPAMNGLKAIQYPIVFPVGLPAGDYKLFVQLGRDDSVIGQEQFWEDVRVAPSSEWTFLPTETFDWNRPIFSNGVRLVDFETPDDSVRVGNPLPLSAVFQSTKDNTSQIILNIRAIHPNGHQRQITEDIQPKWTTWSTGDLMRVESGIYFPPDLPAGTYQLEWQIVEKGEVAQGRNQWLPFSNEWVTYGAIEVEQFPLETELPVVQTLTQVKFGDSIRLHGFDLEQTEKDVKIKLVWQAMQVPEKNYFGFIHLVPDGEQVPIRQEDRVPVNGLRLTNGWREGEVIVDEYAISLNDLPSGTYHLFTGLYEPDGWARPTVTQNDAPLPNNQVPLGEVVIP